jgi:hypothetical protein
MVLVSCEISVLGQAEVVVVKFEAPALLAAIEVKGFDRLAQVGELAQEEVPAAGHAAGSDRELTQTAESDLAKGALG